MGQGQKFRHVDRNSQLKKSTFMRQGPALHFYREAFTTIVLFQKGGMMI